MPRGNSQTQMSKNMKEPTNGSKTISVARGAKMDIPSANSSTSSINSNHSASTSCKDLFEAAKMGDTGSAKILRDKGMGINGVDSNGLSALHHAAEQGHIDMVDYLIRGGIRLDTKDLQGYTVRVDMYI